MQRKVCEIEGTVFSEPCFATLSVVSARVTVVFWWGLVGTGPGEQMWTRDPIRAELGPEYEDVRNGALPGRCVQFRAV